MLTFIALRHAAQEKEVRTHPSATSNAVTYYFDSVSGDDGNRGATASTAWKTLGKLNATVFSPGDTILFKSGSVWIGQLGPRGSGAERHPIIIDKYGGDAKPVINGAGRSEDAVLLKNQEYWEISNLEITNTGETPGPRRGVHLVAENFGDVHHIYLHGLTIHDVNGVDDDKVNGGINYNSIGDSKPSRFIDLRMEDNRIFHVDRSRNFWLVHPLGPFKVVPELGRGGSAQRPP